MPMNMKKRTNTHHPHTLYTPIGFLDVNMHILRKKVPGQEKEKVPGQEKEKVPGQEKVPEKGFVNNLPDNLYIQGHLIRLKVHTVLNLYHMNTVHMVDMNPDPWHPNPLKSDIPMIYPMNYIDIYILEN
jgi:hypothetical protein